MIRCSVCFGLELIVTAPAVPGITCSLMCISQYPQEKSNGPKVPVELRVNIWLGLSAVEKKFNSFAEGTFTVFAEMVHLMTSLSFPLCGGYFYFSPFWKTFTYQKQLHHHHYLKSYPGHLNLRG